jgi:hypothetical protein
VVPLNPRHSSSSGLQPGLRRLYRRISLVLFSVYCTQKLVFLFIAVLEIVCQMKPVMPAVKLSLHPYNSHLSVISWFSLSALTCWKKKGVRDFDTVASESGSPLPSRRFDACRSDQNEKERTKKCMRRGCGHNNRRRDRRCHLSQTGTVRRFRYQCG